VEAADRELPGRSDELLGVVQLIDARHDPDAGRPADDRVPGGIEMPTLFVLTKVDKLKPAEREKRMKAATDRSSASMRSR
jgi:GTP-binding protein EngB required for normal cell division